MSLFSVSPEKESQLVQRMAALGVQLQLQPRARLLLVERRKPNYRHLLRRLELHGVRQQHGHHQREPDRP